jgi:hypothetical protein
MTDDVRKYKDRLSDAKKSSRADYEARHYKTYNSDNKLYCFTAIKGSANGQAVHKVYVRVVLDKITDQDILAMKAIPCFPHETKVIYCKVYKHQKPIIMEFDFMNNLCQ